MDSTRTSYPLYIGDNGRIFCATHAGTTAQVSSFTRDLSGGHIERLSVADLEWLAREVGEPVDCETCTARHRARRLRDLRGTRGG